VELVGLAWIEPVGSVVPRLWGWQDGPVAGHVNGLRWTWLGDRGMVGLWHRNTFPVEEE